MSDIKDDDNASDDAALRETLNESGFKPDADGVRFSAAKPKVLVAGAYKVIRTAAEKARSTLGKGR